MAASTVVPGVTKRTARHDHRNGRGAGVAAGLDHAREQVAFGEDAAHEAVFGHHQHGADVALGHQVHRVAHHGPRGHREELVAAAIPHHVFNQELGHVVFLLCSFVVGRGLISRNRPA
jgi:hypothetical protein